MTKPIALAALFLAGSVAATASLLNEPAPGLPTSASSSMSGEDPTRRGTRDALVVGDAALPVSFAQQRRGERSALVVAEAQTRAPAGDAIRRGTR
jgi:hypothetical protein